MKLDTIYKNKFYRKVIVDSQELIEQDERKERLVEAFKKKLNNEEITSRWDSLPLDEKFHISTFRTMSQIIYKLESLDHCVSYINSYPNTYRQKKNFGRSDYIKYHLENYYGNIVGVFDRCLHLINHLYDLGLAPQDIKYNLISKNKHLEGTEALKVLKIMHKGLEKVRSVRNYIEHQGSLADTELDDISMYELLYRNTETKEKIHKILSAYIKVQYGSYLRNKKKEIGTNNDALVILVAALFNSLHQEYIKGMEKLVPASIAQVPKSIKKLK